MKTKIVFEIDEKDLPLVMTAARKLGVHYQDADGKQSKQDMQDSVRMLALNALRRFIPGVSVKASW